MGEEDHVRVEAEIAAASQGMTRSQQKLEETTQDSPLEPSEPTEPYLISNV